jgi:small subunit ribosomal protein S1
VHISELAPHHVENPREVVNPGDVGRVKILEIDEERRRLSLSFKRVEDQILPVRDEAATSETAPSEEPPSDEPQSEEPQSEEPQSEESQSDEPQAELEEVPELDLSSEVFSAEEAPPESEAEREASPQQLDSNT